MHNMSFAPIHSHGFLCVSIIYYYSFSAHCVLLVPHFQFQLLFHILLVFSLMTRSMFIARARRTVLVCRFFSTTQNARAIVLLFWSTKNSHDDKIYHFKLKLVIRSKSSIVISANGLVFISVKLSKKKYLILYPSYKMDLYCFDIHW